MNATTLNAVEEKAWDIVQGTIQDVRYMLEPVARVDNPTFAQRIANFFDKWTEQGYQAWEKTDRTPYL